MGKIFFWLGIFVAIFVALKFVSVMQRKRAVKGQPAERAESETPSPKNASPSSSTKQLPALLACARCGVHFPSADGIEKEGRFFCSADHAR